LSESGAVNKKAFQLKMFPRQALSIKWDRKMSTLNSFGYGLFTRDSFFVKYDNRLIRESVLYG